MKQVKMKGISVLAWGNFFAAFGGGTILARAMGVLKNVPVLQGDSLLAFLFGTTLGLAVLSIIPKTWTAKMPGPLSLMAAGISYFLFTLLKSSPNPSELSGVTAWIFFIFLSFRFCAWFLARVLRSDISSGHGQKISWVELSYLSGIILGLALWQRSGLIIGISTALLVDCALQCVSAISDFYFQRQFLRGLPDALASTSSVRAAEGFSIVWYGYIAAAVVTMTIGEQIVNFAFAHVVQDEGKLRLAADLLAASYIGSAIAAVICGFFKVQLLRPISDLWIEKAGRIKGQLSESHYSISVTVLIVLCLGSMAFSVIGWGKGWLNEALVLMGIAVAALFYEIIVLALLDHLGEKAKASGRSGMVAFTFGLMGLFGGATLIILIHSPSPMYAIIVTLILSVAVTRFSTARSFETGG